jgi:hypothetical protein
VENADNDRRMLRMLAQNEETIAELYRVYAEQFPRQRAFWSTLAAEEMGHSRLIRNLPSSSDISVRVATTRFDPAVLQVSLDHLREKLAQARGGKLTLKEAMTIALEIETGMVERGFFKVFEGDTPELRRILAALEVETRRHTDKIREGLAKAGRRWRFF